MALTKESSALQMRGSDSLREKLRGNLIHGNW
jgi:hypothetical protein